MITDDILRILSDFLNGRNSEVESSSELISLAKAHQVEGIVYLSQLSQRAKTDKTERHQNKSFTHKEKPDRMIHDPAEYVGAVRHRESAWLDTCVGEIGQLRRRD